jgi:hypothetical protein
LMIGAGSSIPSYQWYVTSVKARSFVFFHMNVLERGQVYASA